MNSVEGTGIVIWLRSKSNRVDIRSRKSDDKYVKSVIQSNLIGDNISGRRIDSISSQKVSISSSRVEVIWWPLRANLIKFHFPCRIVVISGQSKLEIRRITSHINQSCQCISISKNLCKRCATSTIKRIIIVSLHNYIEECQGHWTWSCVCCLIEFQSILPCCQDRTNQINSVNYMVGRWASDWVPCGIFDNEKRAKIAGARPSISRNMNFNSQRFTLVYGSKFPNRTIDRRRVSIGVICVSVCGLPCCQIAASKNKDKQLQDWHLLYRSTTCIHIWFISLIIQLSSRSFHRHWCSVWVISTVTTSCCSHSLLQPGL